MFQTVATQKNFNHDLIDLNLPELDRYTYKFDDGKTERHYRLGNEDMYFASVTTMLGEQPEKKKSLEQWRKRVGDKEADRKMNKGGNRGTRLHEVCEKYILNEPNVCRGAFPDVIELFKLVKPILDERIDNIRAVEARMYSKKLLLAGTVDLVADFDGELTIIDFKTAHNIPNGSVLDGHAIQMCAYAYMWSEITGMDIDRMVNIYAINSGQYSTADRFCCEAKSDVIFKKDYLKQLYAARYVYEKANSSRGVVSKTIEK